MKKPPSPNSPPPTTIIASHYAPPDRLQPGGFVPGAPWAAQLFAAASFLSAFFPPYPATRPMKRLNRVRALSGRLDASRATRQFAARCSGQGHSLPANYAPIHPPGKIRRRYRESGPLECRFRNRVLQRESIPLPVGTRPVPHLFVCI